MKKEELVLLVKELFELGTKVEAEKKLAEIDTLVEAIGEKLESKKKATVGKYLVIEKKHIEAKPAKDGEITRKDKVTGEKIKTPYHTDAKPAHDEIRVKQTRALNK